MNQQGVGKRADQGCDRAPKDHGKVWYVTIMVQYIVAGHIVAIVQYMIVCYSIVRYNIVYKHKDASMVYSTWHLVYST